MAAQNPEITYIIPLKKLHRALRHYLEYPDIELEFKFLCQNSSRSKIVRSSLICSVYDFINTHAQKYAQQGEIHLKGIFNIHLGMFREDFSIFFPNLEFYTEERVQQRKTIAEMPARVILLEEKVRELTDTVIALTAKLNWKEDRARWEKLLLE